MSIFEISSQIYKLQFTFESIYNDEKYYQFLLQFLKVAFSFPFFFSDVKFWVEFVLDKDPNFHFWLDILHR